MVGTKINLAIVTAILAPSIAFAQGKINPPSSVPTVEAPAAKTAAPTQSQPQAPKKAPKPKAASAAAKSANNILYEAWSKVILGGVHVGFIVQRYEFDPKKKEFIGAYLKTSALAGSVSESLKARADSGLKPLGYQYTELIGGKAKTIDASFPNGALVAVLRDGDKPPVTIRKSLPKGTFLSTFLVYTMLSAKDGIKVGARYAYNAVAEEDAGVYPGEATVAGTEDVAGLAAMKVFNTFKEVRFVSYITAKGEPLSTRSPVQSLATEVVPTMEDAVKGQSFTPNSVTAVFGDLPQGKVNPVAMKAASPVATPAPTASPTEQ
jgi:hypothetical protein